MESKILVLHVYSCKKQLTIPPTISPHLGKNISFWESDALTWRLLTNKTEWAKYDKQKAGSEYDNSSWTNATADASMSHPS